MDRETKRAAIQMAYASSVGLSMVIAIFGCLFLGVWLDGKLGTAPYLTLLFLLLGIAAGFRNLYLLIKRSLRDRKPPTTDHASDADRESPPAEKA